MSLPNRTACCSSTALSYSQGLWPRKLEELNESVGGVRIDGVLQHSSVEDISRRNRIVIKSCGGGHVRVVLSSVEWHLLYDFKCFLWSLSSPLSVLTMTSFPFSHDVFFCSDQFWMAHCHILLFHCHSPMRAKCLMLWSSRHGGNEMVNDGSHRWRGC